MTCASHHLPASQPASQQCLVVVVAVAVAVVLLCWSPSRVANGHPPHGRVHRAPRPLRPPAQGPLLWLPCGVEARSGYPAASRHATTSPGAVSAPDHHGAEQVDETRGGVDLHGVAAGLPRRTTRPHAPFRSIAPRNLRSEPLELGVAAGKLLGEPDVVDTAEGRLQAEALDRPANTVHKDGPTVGETNDPPTEIICTGAITQLALHGESAL